VSATISLDASVTITIKDSRGRPVRTLLAAASEPAGTVSAIWDRKNSSGRRVKAGTYSALVQATRSDGSSASSSATFKVS
jgi:flagellar hook assembly protein FlgD